MSRNKREGKFAGWFVGNARTRNPNFTCANRAESRKRWAFKWD